MDDLSDEPMLSLAGEQFLIPQGYGDVDVRHFVASTGVTTMTKLSEVLRQRGLEYT